ncbi:MAG TPA: LacI family DNA-binding transcriptional regulator [Acidimicrobiales bacterium]|nr:LacI family DNA-binding transcriptional regulator [Acidimicrobiales bacterium]
MEGPVGIRDVAARARVSVGTVSNVLNHAHLVAPDTRLRVTDAIASLGFVRNESARHLRAGRSRTIGLVVLDVANPFFTDVALGVEDAVNRAGLSVMLCNSAEDSDKQDRYLTILAEQRVQGILIVPVGRADRRLAELRRRGIPVVLVDHKATRSQCSVSVDDVAGGRAAVAHLLDAGHRRVAFVGGSGRPRQVADRAEGALRALREFGSADDLVTVSVPALNVAGGRSAGNQILAMPDELRPTAAFCANDLIALGLLQKLIQAGARVPDDVAIVGYDDIDFAGAAAVPLSSVRQPRHALGQRAAQLLLEEASPDGHHHRQVVFTPELVVRESSGPPRRRRTSRGVGVAASSKQRRSE